MHAFAVLWIAILGTIFISFILIGVGLKKRFWGILINSCDRMSLSRLQLLAWSWLIISTLFTIAMHYKTVNIEIPTEVWALMGISVGSTAGAIIVKGTKQGKNPDSKKVVGSSVLISRIGLLYKSGDVKKASFWDIFKGEEVSDYLYVDIGKVQMFFFSLAAFLGYAMTLWSTDFNISDGIINFPPISQSLVTIIGISHAGYLTVKASPKTPAQI
jgi:hypothetical protein